MQESHAPDVCWKPSRLLNDLQLSQQLILRLDKEKGITDNSLVPRALDAPGNPETTSGPSASAAEGEGNPEVKTEEATEASAKDQDVEMKDSRPSEDVNGAAVKLEDQDKGNGANGAHSMDIEPRSTSLKRTNFTPSSSSA